VAGDRDEAGDTFATRIASRLSGHGLQVHVLAIPAEPADGDLSGWRAHDPVAFPDALHRAIREARLVDDRPAVTRRPRPVADFYALTDLGNAERLRDHLEGLVRYAAETGFYLWDGSVWVLDRFDAVRAAAHEVARGIAANAAAHKDGTEDGAKVARELHKWASYAQSTRGLDSMIRELSAMPEVALDVDRLDCRHDLLAFRNGTVDLRTGALGPHDPTHLLTRRVDVDFDPDATAPTWDYFLQSVFPSDPQLPAFVQRLVGYGITGHTREQCFAVLWGTGSNGKSVFTDTLTSVFRSITVTTPFSTFETKPNGGIPNDLAALKGARLVMASEGDQGRPMAEAVIKRITGRDLIAARFMRREFFEFAPTFLIFLATNYKPNFRGQDEGLWRRVKLIPWTRYFAPADRDHYLPEKLLAEKAGIVAWAVRGAVDWYANGLGEPSVVVEATRDYRETADNLQGFLPGVLVKDDTAELLGAEAFRAYREWAEEEGLQAREVWTRKTFYGALDERGIPRHKKERGVVLQGVRLALPGETPEAPEGPRTADSGPAKGPAGAAAPELTDYRPEETSA
jgi:putative DNA primase/helicase